MFGQLRRRRFLVGLLAGIALVFIIREVVNETPIADWIMAPLLMEDTAGQVDAIVVPGAGVVGGCIPNLSGTRRMIHAARLWREGKAPLVIVPGGSGTPDCPVSIAMARLATELGVPESRLRVETFSQNTHENGELLALMLRDWGVSRVLIVTDRLHMRRASAVFTSLGFTVERSSVPIYEGHVDNVSMLQAGMREFVALAYYRLRGWIHGEPKSVGDSRSKVAIAPVSVNPNGPLVVLGARYARGWNLANLGGKPIVNRGIDGQQSFELFERFERDVVSEKPSAVLVWGFVNDVSRAQAGKMDATLQRTRDSYTQMVALARTHGIQPILATEVTMRSPGGLTNTLAGWLGALHGKQSYQDGVNVHVLAVDAWLVEFAKREGLLILDFQALLADSSGRRRQVFALPDGSHITEEGYDMLTSYARPILKEYLRAR